ENSLLTLQKVLPVFEALEDWSFEPVKEACMKLVEEMGVKNGVVLWPIRTALSGKQFTPGGAFEIAEILGKEESLKRIAAGIKLLEG
ncbi:MAG: gltX, partial [Firmicutes bacterium]|nr:gltX [Bacillota bacterium]